MAIQSQAKLTAAAEAETQKIGRQLWDHLQQHKPSIFARQWWDDHILSWAMADESVKVQMFRFVDVLPMLRTHEQVTGHLHEYFEDIRQHLPQAARLAMGLAQPNSVLGRALAFNARTNARRMAQRFIAGANVEDVLQTVGKIRKQGFAFTLDLLGEAILSEPEADAYQQEYLNLIAGLAARVNAWPENGLIDRDHHGPIPRVHVSLKLSALTSQFNPTDPAGTTAVVAGRLRTLLRAAHAHHAFIHVDMEQYAVKDLTLAIFKQVLWEDEFRDFPDVGIVIQTYLPDAGRDLADLLDWVRERGTPVWVRLVKGAYWEYETVVAEANGWPIPVYQQKWQSDDNFERQARLLMENYQWLRPAIASHNLRSLAHSIAWARLLEVPPGAYEIQMLYGMAGPQADWLTEQGQRLRIYTPFGELIPGMAYLVRRLLENTSNDSFLRHSFAEDISVEDLLMKPTEVRAPGQPPQERPTPDFTNEPPTDFSRAEAREAMQQALKDVASQLGGTYPLLIDGRAVHATGQIVSYNPSHKNQVIGTVAAATVEQAALAIRSARRAAPSWSSTEPSVRAEYLEKVAAELRNRRFELSAWQVYECGKPWNEAEAEVTEAIDFCEYYALGMRQLATPRRCDVPGEENSLSYRPRGVVVVIAPWNFPLAILTGMTAAGLVTGNTVIMKPAEQSSVVAAKLMEIFQQVGLPPGVVNYLPGRGEEIGPALVDNPEVDLIAFTGSRAVGLDINQRASATAPGQRGVKRVITEMGGKNAILVDDDADLDEAVLAVVQSAFGYAGQKCSACSRAIVLSSVYDAFMQRLLPAVRSLPIGPAEQPGTRVGPVIDEEAYQRILKFIQSAAQENEPVLACSVDSLKEEGYYIGPHVFADTDPDSPVAQQEIFGPVLAILRAADFDDALRIANHTDYALTGGLFSRSPVHLQRFRQEMQAGNLYLNRGITGALVGRQPFGGFKLSGMGSKAGGPNYLLQFLLPINITENTLRRGFAPPAED